MLSFFRSRFRSRLPLASASVFALSFIVVACGGSSADVPSGTPDENTNATTPPDPPPGTPSSKPSGTPAPTPTTTPPSVPTTPPSVPTTPPSVPTTPPANPGVCNALVISGASVAAMQVAANAPPATGGAIANGTYHLVDMTLYTGPGGATGALPVLLKQTVAIHGNTADTIAEFGATTASATATFVTSGASVTSTGTCPSAGAPEIATYSVNGTSLVMFKVNDLGQTFGYTYTP
jgi:hypothetical protein